MSNNTKSYTWNLSPLLSSDNDSQASEKRKEVEEKNNAFIKKWKGRRDYLEDPVVLKEALDEYEALQRNYGTDGDEGYYFWLRSTQDETNPEIKARFNSIQEFSQKLRNEILFFEHSLSQTDPKLQKTFLENKELSIYKHFLKRLFAEGKHLLSDAEEKILNLKYPTAYANWVKMTSGFLSKEERLVSVNGKEETKNFSELLSLMNSQDKKTRDSAASAFNDILSSYTEVAEQEINSILADKKTDDFLRGFNRPDASRHLADDIDTGVVDVLIKTVEESHDIARRFYALKAKLLGVKRLAYHERNVEYGSIQKKYTFEDAQKLVLKVFQNLDKEFAAIFTSFLQNGQIDVYPAKGKRGGAFCAYHLMAQPTFLLLNFNGDLLDVTTLAHELGHGINNELIKQKQHALHFGTPTSTAEVASTFMEDFVLEEIMKGADDSLRLALAMTKLNGDISAIFRQVACYTFEMDLHTVFRQKGYISQKEIGTLFQKNMTAYMGEAVEQSPGSENWWVYWSHIRSFFYVYSYASGLLISKSLQNAVRENPVFIRKVKEFLSTGQAAAPQEIFANLGIDITQPAFWKKGLEEIQRSLEDTEKLASKLGKI